MTLLKCVVSFILSDPDLILDRLYTDTVHPRYTRVSHTVLYIYIQLKVAGAVMSYPRPFRALVGTLMR